MPVVTRSARGPGLLMLHHTAGAKVVSARPPEHSMLLPIPKPLHMPCPCRDCPGPRNQPIQTHVHPSRLGSSQHLLPDTLLGLLSGTSLCVLSLPGPGSQVPPPHSDQKLPEGGLWDSDCFPTFMVLHSAEWPTRKWPTTCWDYMLGPTHNLTLSSQKS